MKFCRNMFGTRRQAGGGFPGFTAEQIVTFILGAVSVAAAVGIIANFNAVTASIAAAVASLLTAGFPVLVIVLAVWVLIGRFRWRNACRFW